MKRTHSWLSSWVLERALTLAAPAAGGKLLDVGCGSGPYRGWFSIDRYIGCDWPHSLHAGSAADVSADASALPFRTGAFDTVLCTEVLEHLVYPERALNEMRRVLAENGRLILSVPLLAGVHEPPHDYYRFTEYGLRALLAGAGFEVTAIYARGGAYLVWLDVTFRTAYALLGAVLTRLRLSPRRREFVFNVALRSPQKLLTLVLGRMPIESITAIPPLPQLTLGYVIVAGTRRPPACAE